MLDILKNRITYISISSILIIASILIFAFGKYNLGIDMTWGIKIEYNYTGSIDIEDIKNISTSLSQEIKIDWKEIINNIEAYKISWEERFVVIAWFDSSIEEKELDIYKVKYKDNLSDSLSEISSDISFVKYINIGKTFGDYIKNTAIQTIIIALVIISLYIAYAFSGSVRGISSMSFAIITIITLFHDIIISSGAYIFTSIFFPEFKIDTFFITALLTILGYSINDTIVVFDRIRSNLKLHWGKKKDLWEIVNLSINETLTRSIYTSLTLFFVLGTIFFFGPETVRGFVLVMMFGTIIGTYSSIFIASPLLYEFNKNKTLTMIEKKEESIEDKIVV